MELRQHIGIFVLISILVYLVAVFDILEEEVEWWAPLGLATFIWGLFEVVYWTFKLLIL